MPSEDTQFKIGNPGNPGGAPRGKRISTWLAELGEMGSLPDPETLPINGRIALAQIQEAMGKRGIKSAQFVADLTESKQATSQVNVYPPGSIGRIDEKLDRFDAPNANA